MSILEFELSLLVAVDAALAESDVSRVSDRVCISQPTVRYCHAALA